MSSPEASRVVVVMDASPVGHNDKDRCAVDDTAVGGSTKYGAALNLINSIVGAGCIGYGGAFAASGGLPALLTIAAVAVLSKGSFDLVIALGVQLAAEMEAKKQPSKHYDEELQQQEAHSSYKAITEKRAPSPTAAVAVSFEDVGRAAYGHAGVTAVVLSKCLFAFGCMVAYFVILKDNAAPALAHLFGLPHVLLINNKQVVTTVLATTLILPLCLQRDIAVLETFSKLKIASYGAIAVILMILAISVQSERDNNSSVETTTSYDTPAWVDHWFTVKAGLLPNTGTFVFAFVSQHVVPMIFASLRPRDRNLTTFGEVSTMAILASAMIMLCVGLPTYLTFWDQASTDIFALYTTPAQANTVNAARLFLSMGMILTYPMPLLSVRDSLIQLLPRTVRHHHVGMSETTQLLENGQLSHNAAPGYDIPWWFRPTKPFQDVVSLTPNSAPTLELVGSLHVVVTVLLWASSLVFALSVPSLGMVLNLVGCLSGATMAFVLPGLFGAKLDYQGWTPFRITLVAVGLFVACLGSYYTVVPIST